MIMARSAEQIALLRGWVQQPRNLW